MNETKERLQEIQEQMNALRAERNRIEADAAYEFHKTLVGKCFRQEWSGYPVVYRFDRIEDECIEGVRAYVYEGEFSVSRYSAVIPDKEKLQSCGRKEIERKEFDAFVNSEFEKVLKEQP